MSMEQEHRPPEGAEASEHNRRRGDRRASELSPELPENRRANDRRLRKPGFLGLIGALFAHKE
ncbi:MAG: hypothetical protein NVSMB5_16300 [Candidatus Velthaea sp.]